MSLSDRSPKILTRGACHGHDKIGTAHHIQKTLLKAIGYSKCFARDGGVAGKQCETGSCQDEVPAI